MAKAILGHVGGTDPRMLAEVANLRRRVRDLQAEVERLAAENAALLGVDGALAEALPDALPDALADEIITLDAARPGQSTPALA